jgi:hypothetical protein
MAEALVLCVITLIVVFFYAVGITIEFHKIRSYHLGRNDRCTQNPCNNCGYRDLSK